MLFQYETDRLILKILKPEYAHMVLDFYNRDRELFEKYETERLPDFYTAAHHQKLLRYEYNAAIKQTTIRYYVFLKEDPSSIIGTVCLHDVSKFYYNSAEIGYKFSSRYHHKGYATEAIKCCLDMRQHFYCHNSIKALCVSYVIMNIPILKCRYRKLKVLLSLLLSDIQVLYLYLVHVPWFALNWYSYRSGPVFVLLMSYTHHSLSTTAFRWWYYIIA